VRTDGLERHITFRVRVTTKTGNWTVLGADSLDTLAALWDVLAAKSGNPIQQYAWARAWVETFGADYDVQIVVAGARQEPSALAPLVRRRDDDGARLELLGVSELHEVTDFLYADSSAVASLTEALQELRFALFLERIPADAPSVAALRRSYRGRGLVICRALAGCPWIPLDASWVHPEQHLNPGRRSDLRRAGRVAERMGPLSFTVSSPTPAELEPLLDEAFRVEAAGWKGCEGTALATDARRGLFFRRYAAAACQNGILRLSFLRIDGRAVAMQLAVECGARFWLLKTGYDEEFARCSPGQLLILHTVRYAAARGLRAYEFLGHVEPWTQMWTRFEHSCLSLEGYPVILQGVAALAADVPRIAWRRLGCVAQDRS
jgi:CelD/BcsL family acetyltransferase involved in cellulose biosynthesis